jgi:hypothetical protein
MTASQPPRWYQYRLSSLLAVMLLVAVFARPGWSELQRRQASGNWGYWRLFAHDKNHEEHRQAAVQRGLEWLQTHQDAADWNVPTHVGQSQESDL